MGDEVALGVEDDGGAVKDERVVAADLVDHDDRHMMAFCDGREHLETDLALALLRRLQKTRRPDLRLAMARLGHAAWRREGTLAAQADMRSGSLARLLPRRPDRRIAGAAAAGDVVTRTLITAMAPGAHCG